jgi:hypothetical protein
VLAEVAAGVRRANQDLARVEQVRRFTLLPAEWTAETGELTPTLKRRRQVATDIEVQHTVIAQATVTRRTRIYARAGFLPVWFNDATPTTSQAICDPRGWPFWLSYSSEVQQQLGAEPLERLQRLGI